MTRCSDRLATFGKTGLSDHCFVECQGSSSSTRARDERVLLTAESEHIINVHRATCGHVHT